MLRITSWPEPDCTAGLKAMTVPRSKPPCMTQTRSAASTSIFQGLSPSPVHGQPPVLIRLRREDPGLRLTVLDRGAGIPRDQRDQALLPFQRLDASRGGSGHCGLGLAIAARVAAAHGGALVTARSEHGPGFAVVLRGRSLAAAVSVASGHS